MLSVLDSAREFFNRNGITSARLVVAVSGGVDSVALFSVLSKLNLGALVCAHVDHGVRSDSGEDAALVKKMCEAVAVPFESVCLTPPSSGLEAWGREERYRFLEFVRERHAADWVVTAHTADDQIETVLMRIFQGREPVGISPVDFKRRVLRPFIGVHKQILIDYCQQNLLPWRDDSTNLDNSFLRNKIRNDYIPALLENGGDRSGLLDLVNSISTEITELRANADRISISLPPFGSKAWLRALTDVLQAIPSEHRWRLAEAAFLPPLEYRLGADRAKLVVDFILQGRVGIQLPGGIELRRKAGGLVARKAEKV